MFEKHKLVPDVTVTDIEGQTHNLWGFRQRSHLALFYDPNASGDQRTGLKTAAANQNKLWNWLGVKPLVLLKMPDGFGAGIYLIDRYGIFIDTLPLAAEPWSEIEKEFMYYEAKHC